MCDKEGMEEGQLVLSGLDDSCYEEAKAPGARSCV